MGGLLVANGTIVTLDPRRPLARALWAEDGVLRAVGEEAEVRRAARPGAEVLDARGGLVLPGLRDGHVHLLSLGRALAALDLRGAGSVDAAVERVRAAAAGAAHDAWILGGGWDETRFSPPVFPGGDDLEEATEGRPAYLKRVDGHAAWINRTAAERAGIEAAAPDPPGGRILRRADGEPSGILLDRAMELVERVLPREDEAARERLLLGALSHCAALGLVEVHDMGTDAATLRALERLDARSAVPLRVHVLVEEPRGDLDAPGSPLAAPPVAAAASPRVAVRGVKLYADGALGSRGAALEEPYADDLGNTGLLLTEPARMAAIAERAVRMGWQVAIHAIGDRAVRIAIDVCERAGASGPPSDGGPRFRIEHAQIVAPEDARRMARLGILASIQPLHAVEDAPWAEARLGRRRLAHAYAWRSLARAGVRLVCGSDAPFGGADPRRAIVAAVHRVDANGDPPGGFHPEQALRLEEAIAAYTAGPAHAAFAGDWRGRLRPGMACDLTVLDGDAAKLLAGDPAEWKAAPIVAAFCDGRRVAPA